MGLLCPQQIGQRRNGVAKKRVSAASKGAVGAAIAFSLLVMGGLMWMEMVGGAGEYEFSTDRFGRWFTQETESQHNDVVEADGKWPLWARLAMNRGEAVGTASWIREDVVAIGELEFQLLGIEGASGVTTCSATEGGQRCGLDAYEIMAMQVGPDGLVACPRSAQVVNGRELSHCHVDGRALSVELLRHGLGKAIDAELQGAGVHESYARSKGLGIWR